MKNTEAINENTQNLDLKTSEEFVELFLGDHKTAFQALEKAKKEIASVIEEIYRRLKSYREVYLSYTGGEEYYGPKIYYFGAGTSGRLGILDASECSPTFSAHPNFFNGVIAGGLRAVTDAVENAEDNESEAQSFVEANIRAQDIVIGISASGNAPFVCKALEQARLLGAFTVAIANNEDAKIFDLAQESVFLDTGAEIVSGSTRLKAGTTQKIVLNMISTGIMVRLKKVYSNLMVDLQAKNKKLKDRALSLVMKVSPCSEDEAKRALSRSKYRVKHAILIAERNISMGEAEALLEHNRYDLREALKSSIN